MARSLFVHRLLGVGWLGPDRDFARGQVERRARAKVSIAVQPADSGGAMLFEP